MYTVCFFWESIMFELLDNRHGFPSSRFTMTINSTFKIMILTGRYLRVKWCHWFSRHWTSIKLCFDASLLLLVLNQIYGRSKNFEERSYTEDWGYCINICALRRNICWVKLRYIFADKTMRDSGMNENQWDYRIKKTFNALRTNVVVSACRKLGTTDSDYQYGQPR